MMSLSDILDLQDVMTTTSDEDIPDLEDIFWTLNVNYGLDKHLYSLNSLQMNYCWNIQNKVDMFITVNNMPHVTTEICEL